MPMRPILVFDSETIADPDMARRVAGDAQLSDEEALARVAPPRQEGEAYGFPKPLYHRVVEIAVCVVTAEGRVETLKPLATGADERALLQAFWSGFGHHATASRIVSFNGRRFDVPVLVQRALSLGVSPAPLFLGDYRQRFRDSHLDLMEILSDYGTSMSLSQHEAATMLGVPGKIGVDGGEVRGMWAEGRTEDIAAYCTCDVATLTLCFARLGVHTGWCSAVEAAEIESGLRSALTSLSEAHAMYQAFLDQNLS